MQDARPEGLGVPVARIRVLGPVALAPTGSGETPALGPRLRRLLAVLALRRNTVVSADALADAVWGEDQPDSPESALHNLVSRLRTALRVSGESTTDSPTLLTRPPGYVLVAGPEDLDAACFELLARRGRADLEGDPAAAAETLSSALGLWRGPACAEFADEDFASPEVARLEGMRATAIEDHADALLALGRPEDAVRLLETLLAEAPLRDRARGQLMRGLYRAGEQAQALASYDAYRRRLAEDLGIDPPPGLQQLYQDILRQDPGLEPVSSERGTGTSTRDSQAPSRTSSGERTWPTSPGNLPPAPPVLVGRDRSLEHLAGSLEVGDVLTLTGPGGVGKTSLALRLATDVASRFPDGAWFCDLSQLRDEGDLALTMMSDLDLQAVSGGDHLANMVTSLRSTRLLLLLDNCEHVLSAVASVVREVHARCPEVTVLSTSRAPLEVADERVVPVDPLSVPPPSWSAAPDSLVQAPAVQLFVERARRRLAGFELGEDNAEAVAEICRRLDGLPLAIELAAARMGALSPQDLAERLSWRFRLLHGGGRSGSERHRTLQALVDWSYDLLDEDHRRAFEVLSLFAGGFELGVAEELVAAVPELGPATDRALTADLVLGLVDRSMVAATTGRVRKRYSMLETLRTYGRERLAGRAWASTARRAHARLVAEKAESAASRLYGPGHVAASTLITRNLDELRSAHVWALENDLDLAIRLVSSLALYVEHRMPAEVPQWALRTIEVADRRGTSQGLAGVCAVAAAGARFTGDLARAAELATRGTDLPCDPSTAAYLRFVLGEVALFEGRFDDVEQLRSQTADLPGADVPQVVRLFHGALGALVCAYRGDVEQATHTAVDLEAEAVRMRSGAAQAWTLYVRAEILLDSDPEAATDLLDRALRLAQEQGDRYAAGVVLVSAASVRGRHGDPSQAVPLFERVVEHWSRLGDWTHQWTSLRGVVDVLLRLGHEEAAAVLMAALLNREGAAPLFGPDAERMTETEAVLRERLGTRSLAELGDRGARMEDEEVVSFARTALAGARQEAQRSR